MSISISPKSKPTSLPSPTRSHTPYMSPSPKLGPTTWSSSSSISLLPGPNTSPRRTARRLSYHLKNRISKYSLPIGLGLFVTSLFLYLTYSNGSYMPHLPSLHTRDEATTYNEGGFIKEEGSSNGLSFLDLDEDELIAEDDLFWDSYKEKQTKSKTEQAEIELMEARRKEVVKTNKVHSLRALIWWISQGGVLPTAWDIPSKETVLKMGSSGMEKLLEGIEGGPVGDEIFQEGWADFAKDRYRTVVFSKTYCPYSKNAKRILENYQLTPEAYVIELDQRPDYTYLQTLLSYLTSRRTVPNIILDFISVGGSDDLTLIHGEGGLQRKFQEMGVLPGWEWRAQSHVKAPASEEVDEEAKRLVDEEAKRLVDEVIQEEAEAGDL